MPLTQQTDARFESGDIVFDMTDEDGTVVHVHVEGEALSDYAGRWSIPGEPEEILNVALPEILRVASDKFDGYKIKPIYIYVLSDDLNP
jgi:hypothetical protein